MKDSDVQREIDRMTENRTNQALPMKTINTTIGEPYVSVIDCGDTFAIQLHRYGRVVVNLDKRVIPEMIEYLQRLQKDTE